MDQHVIELVGLTKKYGSFMAVDHLSLTIPRGEVFGLLGPNGAGKSTTILMMLGLTEPASGSVKVCGIDSTSNPVEVKRRVGYLPEDVGFYDDRSGLENLVYTARLNGMTEKEAAEKAGNVLSKVGLEEQKTKKTGKYSRGMRQRLGLADVLIKNPEVIILDEPTLGLDPGGVQELLELIVQLSREEGLTVLLSSHHLHQVQQVCDRVGLFVSGKLIAEGDIGELSRKLFSGEPFIVEAGISQAGPDMPNPAGKMRSGAGTADKAGKSSTGTSGIPSDLTGSLRQIKGVLTVDTQNGLLQVGCSRDATADIARVIVESGAGLNYLRKKEYGLDDIYHRYFQGGKIYE